MGQEEARRLPHLGDQRVEVVGRGSPAKRLDRLLRGHLRQEPVLRAVDELELLPFLDRLDSRPQLLGDLVVWALEYRSDSRVWMSSKVERSVYSRGVNLAEMV